MTKQIDKIMEQAQVFASAWSLVGGRFDGGNAMDDAEVAKNELRQMVAEALAEQPAHDQRPFCYHDGRNIVGKEYADHSDVFPLYARPQAREPLTDEQIEALAKALEAQGDTLRHFARAIELAHGIGEKK